MTAPELKRILLIEDEVDIQLIARLALEKVGGFEVEICGSGNEAVEMINFYIPDLILLDVMMPGMDGPGTLRELRKVPSTKTTPIIFMTAKVQAHELIEYKNMGAVDVIAKPFDPMTLSANIKQIWRQVNG